MLRKALSVLMCLVGVLGAWAQNAPLSAELQKARQEFADAGLGIFIHWGIYSMYGQGEWFLHSRGVNAEEYAKAAKGFYPANFDARQWADAFRDAGARYVTFTSRHHDGFSMWRTAQSPYNIVDDTPWGRDVVGELAEACRRDSLRLHLYYSLIDWTRDDYPWGRTGHATGRDSLRADWPHYYAFMQRQLDELLTQYGPMGAIWFDGVWDHDQDTIPFDWQLGGLYDQIHQLQPGCLVANNHHLTPFEGEDIQVFERDVPGENHAGYSGESGISASLPLETCQTMNGSWGYRVTDLDWKPLDEIVRLLVKTRGMGANLLLNVGPQPDGSIPEASLERLRGLGQWMRANGETIYGARGSDFDPQPWGTSTRRGDTVYVHVLTPDSLEIAVPMTRRVLSATERATGRAVDFERHEGSNAITLHLTPLEATVPDRIITLVTEG